MTEFLRGIEELFDIFCNDQKQRRKLKEINKLKMNEDDFAFYEDQIGPRKKNLWMLLNQSISLIKIFFKKCLKNNPILIIQFQQAQQILIL